MRRRSWYLLASAVVVLAMALPASASGRSGGQADLTLDLGPACAGGGTVTYSWSGFRKARGVVVDVYDADTGTHPVQQTVAAHGTSGSVTFTFDERSGDNYTATASVTRKHGTVAASTRVEYGSAGCG
jgi:hypothetical protein